MDYVEESEMRANRLFYVGMYVINEKSGVRPEYDSFLIIIKNIYVSSTAPSPPPVEVSINKNNQ